MLFPARLSGLSVAEICFEGLFPEQDKSSARKTAVIRGVCFIHRRSKSKKAGDASVRRCKSRQARYGVLLFFVDSLNNPVRR